ncbi:hypothetical protein MBLNU459_g1379t1 [Dothideomycetes sp. NU459]
MDSLLHASRKILLERAASGNQTPTAQQTLDVSPPAYSDVCPDGYPKQPADYDCADSDSESDIDADEDPAPVTLTLNASTHVQGSGNLVTTPALSDATRFCALLLAAVQKLNAAAETGVAASSPLPSPSPLTALSPLSAATTAGGAEAGQGSNRVRPTLRVQLVVNCGVTVTGDRNVIGYRLPQTLSPGVKRKEPEDAETGPAAKKVEVAAENE